MGPWRREVRSFLELFALTGVAVVQPVLDLLAKNASLFVTLKSTKGETIALTLLVVLVPPTVLWLVEVIVGLIVPAARRFAHAILAAAVVGVLAVQALKKQTDLSSRALVGVALVIAIGAGIVIFRFEIVRLWLRFLAIAPAIFAVMFLFFSPVTTAVFDGGPGAAEANVGNPKRVVMIVLDELPLESLLDGNGHIDATLFPHFAELAGDSTWYRNNTTVAPNTEQAVPAIVTGSYQTDTPALPVAEVHPHSLFTLLGDTYDMNVHETVTQLCPRDICGETSAIAGRHGLGALLSDTVDLWRESASPGTEPEPMTFDASSVAGAAVPAGLGFVRSLEPADDARLDFLHVLLPHQPWHLRAGMRDDRQRGRTRGLTITWVNEWAALSARERHQLQLQATDDLLGRVTAKLKRIGSYDESMIVLTADHGISFATKSPERIVSAMNWPQIMWTPLIIKSPGPREGKVDDRPVESIDILPTIADTLDVKLPWLVDGHSLLGEAQPDGPRHISKWWIDPAAPSPSQLDTYDGPTGFDEVIHAGAVGTGTDPSLRLYRLGPYGDLVGRAAGPFVDHTAPRPVGAVSDRGDFEHVRPAAKEIPWAYVQGRLRNVEPNRSLAITVNGVVAGTSTAIARRPGAPQTLFWATLAPQLFVEGHNELGVYAVTGDPRAPRLVPARLRR